MKKILSVAFLACACTYALPAAAQNDLVQEAPYVGVFGGYTLPSGVFTNTKNFSYQPRLNGGIFCEFDRLDHLYMNGGFIYDQEETGPVTLSPLDNTKKYSSNLDFDYVQIYGKLKWNMQLTKGISLYGVGGIYGGLLVSGSYVASDGTVTNATSDMHRINSGLLGGGGLCFKIYKLKINVEADANYGFFFTMRDLPFRDQFYEAGIRGIVGLSYPLE